MRKLFTSITAFIVVFCALSCSCSGTASAQTKKDNKPYNLQKAWDVLQEDQDEAQAIKLLNEQLRSRPDNVECWMLPEAIKAFDRAIEIDPADAFAYYAKG